MINQTNQQPKTSPFAFLGEVSALYKNGVPVPTERISVALDSIADNLSALKAFCFTRIDGIVKVHVAY
jgi:hypothetical protein